MQENNNQALTFKGQKRMLPTVITALIFLFNPCINIVDILPDFIAYFLLAHAFYAPSVAAPYFEEARRAFIKLGFINLAKIPSLFIVTAVRSGNTLDYDVFALATFVFATLEIIFIIPAGKNTFDALSYLGERSNAESLIRSDSLASTDALRSFTLVFSILKCALYCAPELFRLTRSVDSGTSISVISGSRYYPFAMLLALLIGTVVGSVWLIRTVKYVKYIKREGKFFDAISALINEGSRDEYRKRLAHKKIGTVFLIFNVAAILSIDLIFDNFQEINLLPNPIFGILFTVALALLSSYTENAEDNRKYALLAGVSYTAVSIAQFILSVLFLTEHGYDSLIEIANVAAKRAYKTVEILSIVEFIAYAALCYVFFMIMNSFIKTNLGHGDRFGKGGAHDEYFAEIKKKTVVYTVLIALYGLAAAVNVFIKGSVKLIFTDPSDVTMPTMIVSSLPWFSLVVTVISIIMIFYSVYYFAYIKDELD